MWLARLYAVILLTAVTLSLGSAAESSSESAQVSRTERQYYPYQEYGYLTRQIADGLTVIGDVFLLGLMGLPIIGLMGMAIAPLLGLASRSKTTNSATVSRKRGKRELIEFANSSIVYVGNIMDVYSNLEAEFHRNNIAETECQLWAVCQVHAVTERSIFADKLRQLIRMQRDIEKTEVVPLSNLFFGSYIQAAKKGERRQNCNSIYKQCTKPPELFDTTRDT